MNKSSQKNLKVVIAVLTVLLAGIVGYLIIAGNNSSTSQKPQPKNSSTGDVSTMMSKVSMGMPKPEVNQAIGEPYECTKAGPATDQGAQYNMEQCNYGHESATNHLSVTSMNGKVSRTTSVNSSAR